MMMTLQFKLIINTWSTRHGESSVLNMIFQKQNPVIWFGTSLNQENQFQNIPPYFITLYMVVFNIPSYSYLYGGRSKENLYLMMFSYFISWHKDSKSEYSSMLKGSPQSYPDQRLAQPPPEVDQQHFVASCGRNLHPTTMESNKKHVFTLICPLSDVCATVLSIFKHDVHQK